LKIVFFGTPDFAAVSLKRLADTGHDVLCAVTSPDKPAGRGKKLTQSPVKKFSIDSNIYLLQPDTLRGGGIAEEIRKLAPDIIVTAAYGKILPPSLLSIPKYGSINIHASLLPKYRGAAPIQRAIIAGETVTGVCSMYMSEGLDEGDVIMARETTIGDEETAGDLFIRLAEIGADVLTETLSAINNGTAVRTPQDAAMATYAPPIQKSEARIDWTKPARSIVCHIRGMNPSPGAKADLGGEILGIFAAAFTEHTSNGSAPGAVISADKSGIRVSCGGGETVTILEVQSAGGKKMSSENWLRGHSIAAGTILS